MIYLLPNDRTYRAEVVQRMKDQIREVQNFYAEQMELHGYGRITFRVETDEKGEVVVHRVDGQFPVSHYRGWSGFDPALEDVGRTFDLMADNIYFIVGDGDNYDAGAASGGRNRGATWVPDELPFGTNAHELGHAFGLPHDFRDDKYIMSYGEASYQLSECSAKHLAVHPYFNQDIPLEPNMQPTIDLISLRTYPTGSGNIPISITISNLQGLHLAELLVTTRQPHLAAGSLERVACQELAGEGNAVVNFNYDGLAPSYLNASAPARNIYDHRYPFNPDVHDIFVHVVDVEGNVGILSTALFSETLQPISILFGNNQMGLLGTPLPDPLVVEVRDLNDGRVRKGVTVTFAVKSGGGRLSVEHVETDYAGRAESILTLGRSLETNTVYVSVAGVEQVATFYAAAGAAVDIPDTTLRAAIATTLGKEAGTPIALAEMATLKELIALDENISELDGIQHATYLIQLVLYKNSITDVSPLSRLTNLGHLYLSFNSITDVSPLSGLTNLGYLYLDHNNISDVQALSGLVNLKQLVLSFNSITDVSPLSGLTNLNGLSLGFNNMSDVSAIVPTLSDLTNLRKLGLSGNDIRDVTPLSRLNGIGVLTLDANQISDISALLGWTDLEHLTLQGNPLSYSSIYTHIPALQERGVEVNFDNRAPTTLMKISGDDQTGDPDATLANPFVVEIQDQTGVAFAGVPVTFSVTSGGGRFSATTATTDSDGRAESTLTLGPNSGVNTVTVSVTGIQEQQTFNAEGIRTPLAFWITSGFDQKGTIGEALPRPIVVYVAGQSGEPFRDVEVTFTVIGGGGTLSVTRTTTDSDGQAESILTLGPDPGTNTVEVSVTGIEQSQTATAIGELPPVPEDVNRDEVVNILDLVLVASVLGDGGTDSAADVNGDGVVNILDLVLVAGALGEAAAAPSAWHRDLEIAPTRADVGQWLAQAQGLDLGDAPSQRGVLFLEQLLAALTPKQTMLLPNYPNPFNPETWIPYQLAVPAEVTVTIYDVNGAAIRRLKIGYQAAGMYHSRGRAAYWDGCNERGEPVASGLYFYMLNAGDYSASRKMVILK